MRIVEANRLKDKAEKITPNSSTNANLVETGDPSNVNRFKGKAKEKQQQWKSRKPNQNKFHKSEAKLQKPPSVWLKRTWLLMLMIGCWALELPDTFVPTRKCFKTLKKLWMEIVSTWKTFPLLASREKGRCPSSSLLEKPLPLIMCCMFPLYLVT
ncbi:hypothetical protein LIER_02355 [Lithospermum erythrorhizon]|uniref:Uncharacterized protein n=1 Tax=Lithospermum erythrorhizon TaxID=34254 RepID=A0AAV3NP46_LITER